MIVIIVTLPRLPPTHLEYSFVDSLAFAVRGLDVRGLAVTNVSRIVSVGGSICRILRGLEAPGSSICRILRVWEVLGGSICRILRGLESAASNEPNQPKVPGGSA